MPPQPELQKNLQSILDQLQAAKQQIVAGAPINLASTQSRIDAFCQQVTALTPPERAEMQMQLIGLLDEANKLYALLQEKHAEITTQLKSLKPQQQALKAYGKAALNKPEDQ